MKLKYYKGSLLFFFLYAIVLIIALLYLQMIKHGDFVKLLNTGVNPFFNEFFKAITHIGDGIFYGVIVLVLIFVNRRHALVFSILGIVMGLVSYVLKQIVFHGEPRPLNYFGDDSNLVLIDGVKQLAYNSFPSGHTMTAFVLGTYFALFFRSQVWSFALFVIAILAGISRVYLLHHFLLDIVAGSVIGVMITLLIWMFFESYLIDNEKSRRKWVNEYNLTKRKNS